MHRRRGLGERCGRRAGNEPPDLIDQTDAAAAWDGTNYLVLWDEFDQIEKTVDTRGARVRPDGTVLDPDGLPIVTGRVTGPALAFGGTVYLVAWSEYVNGGNGSDVFAERVTTDGVVLDPGGFPVSTAPGDHQDR